MNLNEDELSDIILEGRALVSGDPKTWKIPKTLANQFGEADETSANDSVRTWWANMRRDEDALFERLGGEKRAELIALVIEFDGLWLNYMHTLSEQRSLRNCIVGMLRHGLNVGEVAELCRTGKHHIVRALVITRDVTNDEVFQRIEAEELLRKGLLQKDVAVKVGLSKDQINSWAKTLGIESAAMAPIAVRERALELHDDGMVANDIVVALRTEYPAVTIKPMTVYKWISRRKLAATIEAAAS